MSLPADETEANPAGEKKPAAQEERCFTKSRQERLLVKVVMILREKGSRLLKDIFIPGQRRSA